MVISTDTAPDERSRRPRDRKAQIAAAAAGLFRDLGYHRVSVEDIAGAVGITGRAIYRHFDTKQDLLTHIVFAGLDRVDDACAAGTTSHDVVVALASVAFDQRHLGVLVQREARNLAPTDQDVVERRVDAIADRLTDLVQVDRPDLHRDEAAFLARCALSVFASPSHHHVGLTRPAAEGVVVAMVEATMGAPVRLGAPPSGHRTAVERASRREAVLAAAIELFGRRGFDAVRMEDVGAAAGITGPSIYEHFTGKADLLMAALIRGAEWLQLGLAESLVPKDPPAIVLERVVRSYLTFTMEHRDLMRVCLREAINLPDDERSALRRVQHQYLAEWARLVAAARPDLTDSEAWFFTHGGVSVVNETVEAAGPFELVPVALAVLLGSEV
jgi:AcrR family transcriptional regulator